MGGESDPDQERYSKDRNDESKVSFMVAREAFREHLSRWARAYRERHGISRPRNAGMAFELEAILAAFASLVDCDQDRLMAIGLEQVARMRNLPTTTEIWEQKLDVIERQPASLFAEDHGPADRRRGHGATGTVLPKRGRKSKGSDPTPKANHAPVRVR